MQAFNLGLHPALFCPCQRWHWGPFKRDYGVPIRKDPRLSFLPNVLNRRTKWWSQWTPTRTISMGWSDRGVYLRVLQVIALPLNGKGKQEFTAAWMKPQKKKKKKSWEDAEKWPSKNLVFSRGNMELDLFNSFHLNEKEQASHQTMLHKCNKKVPPAGVKLLRDISKIWLVKRDLRVQD